MKSCRFCGGRELRILANYSQYPIFIGCSDKSREHDALYDFVIYLCKSCGVIQQIDLPPLEILYREPRFFGRGKMWQEHYDAYSQFVAAGLPRGARVMEIGGGPGHLLKRLAAADNSLHLYDVEPCPLYDLQNVSTFRAYFDLEFDTDDRFDAIYSSHLVEHLSDVHAFFDKARSLLVQNGSLYTACPNIAESFKHRHLNAFTTDHFNYFSPSVFADLAAQHGFTVKRFLPFRDHGMYFHLGLSQGGSAATSGRASALEVEQGFDTYIDTVNRFAQSIPAKIGDQVYVFGAHAFTITFLRHLPKNFECRAVLDNEPTKQNRRLCGTDLPCVSPEALRDAIEPTVLIYMGAYTQEIVQQLLAINPGTRLIRLDEFQ
jgi:SAM-dependent methyltransferase